MFVTKILAVIKIGIFPNQEMLAYSHIHSFDGNISKFKLENR